MSRTQDEEFNLCQNNLLKLEETLTSIQSNLTASLTSWKATFRSTLDLSGSLRSFFERNESSYTVASLRFESVHDAIHTSKMAMLEKLTADHLTAPITQYLATLTDTRRRIKDRDTARQAFEHYHSKILKLRADKDVLTAKNKFGLKDHEKLQRNEAKYRESAIAYRTCNRAVAAEMWEVWRKRWDVMEDVMHEVVKNEVLFVRALANQLDPLLVDVKKVKAEGKVGRGRLSEGKEAPFFTAKPPVGLEELEEDDKKREKIKRKGSGRRGEDDGLEGGEAGEREEEEDEDALFEDADDPVERKRPPVKRREEVKAAPVPVVRRKLPAPSRAAYMEEEQEEEEGAEAAYEEPPPEEEEDVEVFSSHDFFAPAASAPARRPPQRSSPAPPASLPKKLPPQKRAPLAPTPGDPFAALTAAGSGGGGLSASPIDPFFASASSNVLASNPSPAPPPFAAKKRAGMAVDASAVDFFANAMSVSTPSPVHSAFAPPPPLPFTDPAKPKVVKKAPTSAAFGGGLPPLPSQSSTGVVVVGTTPSLASPSPPPPSTPQ